MAKTPPADQAQSTAGIKSAAEFDIDAALLRINQIKKLREALPNIFEKMAWVAMTAERIPKRGKNREQNYDFSTEGDIVSEVTKYASLAGLTVSMNQFKPQVELYMSQPGKWTQHWYVGGEIIIIDVITKEREKRRFFGYSRDPGDKAAWKASTGLKKYAYAQTFGITTGDDPEFHPVGDPDDRGNQGNGNQGNGQQNGGGKKTDAQKAAEKAEVDAKKKYQERMRTAYREIDKLRAKLIEIGQYPDVEKSTEAIRKLIPKAAAVTGRKLENGDPITELRDCTADELEKIIDALNGFIAKHQGYDVETKLPEVAAPAPGSNCVACGYNGSHKDGCPEAPPADANADQPTGGATSPAETQLPLDTPGGTE